MNFSHPLFMRFMKLNSIVRRFLIGLVFYLIWYADMFYCAHSLLGPWIAGITLVIFCWAWGIWNLMYIFMRGLLSFARIYLIFLR